MRIEFGPAVTLSDYRSPIQNGEGSHPYTLQRVPIATRRPDRSPLEVLSVLSGFLYTSGGGVKGRRGGFVGCVGLFLYTRGRGKRRAIIRNTRVLSVLSGVLTIPLPPRSKGIFCPTVCPAGSARLRFVLMRTCGHGLQVTADMLHLHSPPHLAGPCFTSPRGQSIWAGPPPAVPCRRECSQCRLSSRHRLFKNAFPSHLEAENRPLKAVRVFRVYGRTVLTLPRFRSHFSHIWRTKNPASPRRNGVYKRMAARLGIEPRLSESESLVLPLHHRAVRKIVWGAGRAPKLEPAMGFEPATACLQNRCSTVELRRQIQGRHDMRSLKNKAS